MPNIKNQQSTMSSNSAGKGDSLRKGANLNAYWQNYDNIFARKTWTDWAEQFGDIVLDPDGFDRKDWSKKYTLEEYKAGLPHCTVMNFNKNARL
jgi:hypothetical protein